MAISRRQGRDCRPPSHKRRLEGHTNAAHDMSADRHMEREKIRMHLQIEDVHGREILDSRGNPDGRGGGDPGWRTARAGGRAQRRLHRPL